MRVLLVEDSDALRTTLRRWLVAHGWIVDEATDCVRALEFLHTYRYEILLLDLGLPRVDGLSVLKALRADGAATRVMVLSARDRTADRVEALNLGADDYLVKPFAFEELASRLHALMRRSLEVRAPSLTHGALTVNPASRVASVDGTVLPLTPKEYLLLETLLRRRGEVLSRASLFEQLYDSHSDSSDKVIEVLVSTLRRKLAQAGLPDPIETRRGFGYCIG
ncbi:MAG: response regulator transcription factor [Gammaproteobacteria bacterium]